VTRRGSRDRYAVDLDEWHSHRIARVLTQLRDDEREMAMTYANEVVTTWGRVARACWPAGGLRAAHRRGPRVRRKLLRLGKRLTARLAAQGPSPRAALSYQKNLGAD
jgi:hypothetical protein